MLRASKHLRRGNIATIFVEHDVVVFMGLCYMRCVWFCRQFIEGWMASTLGTSGCTLAHGTPSV